MTSKSARNWIMGVCVFSMAAARVQAAGFGLYEASARGNAMGGALVGSTGDASANYYNPANLTELPGTHTLGGVTMVQPVLDIKAGGEKNNLDSDCFAVPHLYGSQQLSDSWFAGVGIYSEYGLGTKYDRDWALKSSSTETTLETMTFNPNLAYKVTDRLSAAAGFRAMYLDFENNRTPLQNTAVGTLPSPPFRPGTPVYGNMRTSVNGDSWGYGYDMALSYKLTDTLDAGFVYRSLVRQTVKGEVDVESSAHSAYPIAIPNPLPEGEASARGGLELPASYTAGLNYHPTEKLNLGAAAIYTEWSSYDELSMDFGPTLRNHEKLTGTSEEKSWDDVWRLSLGGEYLFTERWSVMGGYVYDMDPIDKNHADTMLPPGDRHIVSGGLGYAINTWKICASYGLIIMEPRTREIGTTEAKFDDGFCHLLALSVAKSF